MKKILVIILSLTVLAGCGDWLMEQPRGVEIANKVEHYEGLIYGTDLCFIREVFPYMSFENTCTQDGYGAMYAEVGTAECNAYRWQADIFRPDEECNEWNLPASYIYSLNIVVNEVMDAVDGTEAERLAVQSEARVLRAYMHFLMAQFFGRPYNSATADTDLCVPIITEAKTVGIELPRKTVAEVYSFILKEMEESVEHLQDRAPHHRRVFKTAGYAMLGKVYWMMGRYDDALEAFETAFEAVRTYGTQLIDYNTLVAGGEMSDYPTDDKLNPERLFNLESMYLLWHVVYPMSYGSLLMYLDSNVLTRYFTDVNDLRLSYIEGFNSGKTAWGRSISSTEQYYITINRMVGNFGMNLPDLYLMYAECLARDGQAGEAVALLEELRAARFPAGKSAVPTESTSGDALVQFCVAERFREHMGYGDNWFDMRRLWNDPLFQDLKSMYKRTVGSQTYELTEARIVMRIPPQILAWHPEYVDNE